MRPYVGKWESALSGKGGKWESALSGKGGKWESALRGKGASGNGLSGNTFFPRSHSGSSESKCS